MFTRKVKTILLKTCSIIRVGMVVYFNIVRY